MIVTLALAVGAMSGAHADIWLSGDDPVVQIQKHKQTPADFMDLFKADSDSAWSTAAPNVKVFKISHQFALRGTDEQLNTLFSDLKRRHIALAIEMGVLVGSERCGMGVEGYGLQPAVENAAKRIKSHGGELAYVSFDEPVWHGHGGKGLTGAGKKFCSDPVADLVDQIAPKLAILQQYFPNAQFGDIDPISGQHPELRDDTIAFFDLMNQKSKVKLSFFHADVAWGIPGWQPILEGLSEALHKRGLRIGVICDGGSDEVKGREAKTDEEWVGRAVQRCKAIAANPKIKPDDFIVQSWEPLPTKMLPDTDAGALTHAVSALSKLAH